MAEWAKVEHAADRTVTSDVPGQGRSQAHRSRCRRGVRWLRDEAGKTFYAVGGAWRSFARLHMEQAGYPRYISSTTTRSRAEEARVARLIAVQAPSRWRRCRAYHAGASTPCRWPVSRLIVCWQR